MNLIFKNGQDAHSTVGLIFGNRQDAYSTVGLILWNRQDAYSTVGLIFVERARCLFHSRIDFCGTGKMPIPQ
jgi:hypothetical protein